MLKKSTILIVAVLFLVTTVYYYWSMAHTYVIPNIDSPFYYLQVNSILETGVVVYPDPPISFYSFTLFALLLGTEAGVMVGSAVFAAASSIGFFFLFRYMFKSDIPAVAAAVVCTFSAGHIMMASNLMKNSVGIIFLVGTIFFLQKLLDSDTHLKRNVLGAVGFFALTMFSHVLDEGIALLFIGLYLVFSLFFVQRKKLLVRFSAVLAAAVAMAVSVFVLLPDYFGDFDKGVTLVSLVSSSSTTGQAIGGGNGPGMGNVTDYFIYAILAVGVCLSVYGWLRGDRKKVVLLTSAVVMGILLVLPNIPADYSSRFQLMAFIPASIIIGYACSMIKRRDALVLVAFLMILPVALTGFNTASNMTPSISQQGYVDLQQMTTMISTDNTVLIAQEAGMAYWPQYVLNLPVVSDSTEWLQNGYTVYLLVGSQMPAGQNTPNGAGPGNGRDGFGVPSLPGQQNGFPDGPNAGNLPNNLAQNSGSTAGVDVSNATVVYRGQSYVLYELEE